jgi:hypothetical protein
MEALLDFSQPLNVELLDQVVKVMYHGQEPQRSQADRVLNTFREHPESWREAYKIIDAPVCLESKFFALQIMESVIRFRWRSLPLEQRESFKTYLTKYILAVRCRLWRLGGWEQGLWLPGPPARARSPSHTRSLCSSLLSPTPPPPLFPPPSAVL